MRFFNTRHALACAVALSLPDVTSASAQALPSPIARDQCYHFLYPDSARDSLPDRFAEFVLLKPGTDSGAVLSGVGKTHSRAFWRMFLLGGRWERQARHLVLHFTNGFSDVVYLFDTTHRDTLNGQIRFLYDVVDQRPPPAPVLALAISCGEADLQGPYNER